MLCKRESRAINSMALTLLLWCVCSYGDSVAPEKIECLLKKSDNIFVANISSGEVKDLGFNYSIELNEKIKTLRKYSELTNVSIYTNLYRLELGKNYLLLFNEDLTRINWVFEFEMDLYGRLWLKTFLKDYYIYPKELIKQKTIVLVNQDDSEDFYGDYLLIDWPDFKKFMMQN